MYVAVKTSVEKCPFDSRYLQVSKLFENVGKSANPFQCLLLCTFDPNLDKWLSPRVTHQILTCEHRGSGQQILCAFVKPKDF